MIKEIKHNRLVIDFKKKFEQVSYCISLSFITNCNHTKSDSRLYSIHKHIFFIYIDKIIELIPTELEEQEIIDFINSNFNKNNYIVNIFDKYFKKINVL